MTSRRRAHRGWYLAPVVAIVLAGTTPVAPAAGAPTPTPTPSAGKPSASAPAVRWSVAAANAKGPDGRTRYSYEGVKPGATVHDYLSITNLGNAPITFRVYAADGITTADGSIGLATADVKPADVGAWTRVAHGTVRVPARKRVVEPFTIAVPANATPGDHAGGVIASISEKAAGSEVRRESRFAVAAYLRVAGPLTARLGVESVSTAYEGTANPFGGGDTVIGYTVHNTGNVRLAGVESVSVTSPFGTEATMQRATLAQLLPGHSVRATVRLTGVLPAGPLKVHVTITPVQVEGAPRITTPPAPDSKTVSLWATPWPQLVVLLILVAFAVGLWWFIRWTRRRMREELAAAEARGRLAGAGLDGGVVGPFFEPAGPAPVTAAHNGARPGHHHPIDSDRAGEATPPAAPDPD